MTSKLKFVKKRVLITSLFWTNGTVVMFWMPLSRERPFRKPFWLCLSKRRETSMLSRSRSSPSRTPPGPSYAPRYRQYSSIELIHLPALSSNVPKQGGLTTSVSWLFPPTTQLNLNSKIYKPNMSVNCKLSFNPTTMFARKNSASWTSGVRRRRLLRMRSLRFQATWTLQLSSREMKMVVTTQSSSSRSIHSSLLRFPIYKKT